MTIFQVNLSSPRFSSLQYVSNLKEHTEILQIHHIHMVARVTRCSLTLTAMPRGFDADVFTGWMPSCRPTNIIKAVKAINNRVLINSIQTTCDS